MVCVDVCEKKRNMRSKGDTLWWKEEVNDAALRKMHTGRYVAIVLSRIKTGKKYERSSFKNNMREGCRGVYRIKKLLKWMFRLVIGLKTDIKEVEGGSDGKLCFSEKERGKVWKDYMQWFMNEENDWDHDVEGDAVHGPVICEHREEVLQALYEMNTGKSCGPSEVSLELIAASG